ncbi:MAG TPA: tetratricopeptide repeat protein [Acidobacteriota bacterium]
MRWESRRRRWSKAPISLLLCISVGCATHPVRVSSPIERSRQARKAYRSNAPLALSEYIRTVLKISQQNTLSNEEKLLILQGRRPEMAELSRRAQGTDDTSARRSLADAYLNEGLYLQAFQLYQDLRQRSGDDRDLYLALSRIWDHWEDYVLAQKYAELAVALDPKSAEAMELLGRIHLHRNDPESAIQSLARAQQLAPAKISVQGNLGYAHLAHGDWEKAATHLRQTIELDWAIPEVRNDLGIALAYSGDRYGAFVEFMAAARPPVAFNNVGVADMAQQKWLQAQDAFRRALELDPAYQKALVNLSEAESHLPYPTIVNLPPMPTRPHLLRFPVLSPPAAAPIHSTEMRPSGLGETSTNLAIDKPRDAPVLLREPKTLPQILSAERTEVKPAGDLMPSDNLGNFPAEAAAVGEQNTNKKVMGDRTVRLNPSLDLTRHLDVLHEDLIAGWTTGIDKRLRVRATAPFGWQTLAFLRVTVAVAFTWLPIAARSPQ